MQAITTVYKCPTDTHGARILVRCQAARMYVAWNDAVDVEENHDRAAKAMCKRMGWTRKLYGNLVRGGLLTGEYVYVFDKAEWCRVMID